MDCNRARELMWDEPENEELLLHIKTCPECAEEYALVKKTLGALSSDEGLTDKIIAGVRKNSRRITVLRITKIAAALTVVLAVGIFAKIAIDNGLKKADSAESITMNDADVGMLREEKSTSSGNTADGTHTANKDYSSTLEYDTAEPETPAAEPEAPAEEAEPSMDSVTEHPIIRPAMPEAPREPEEESVEGENSNDVNILLNVYRDMHSISNHTADIVVDGGDISEALDILSELGAVEKDGRLEIDGDVYFKVQGILEDSGFVILLASSSETVTKTVIYFNDKLQ